MGKVEAVKAMALVEQRVTGDLMVNPRICPKTYASRYCLFTASRAAAGSVRPVSLHGEFEVGPARLSTAEALEERLTYGCPVVPGKMPLADKSMNCVMVFTRRELSCGFYCFLVRRVKSCAV